MSICHSGRLLDVTYPVARMRSMIPRILRRLALWMGSDRPIPWCTGGVFGGVESPIDDASGVVAKESIDETDGVLLRELWDIEPVGSGCVRFIDTQLERERGGIGDMVRCAVRHGSRPRVRTSVCCIQRNRYVGPIAVCGTEDHWT